MAQVILDVKGVSKATQMLRRVEKKFPANLKEEYSKTIYQKLRRIYTHKQDTGAILNSIKLIKKPRFNKITMGGTNQTMRDASKNSPAVDYTKFVEVTGSKAHRFFLPANSPSNKLRGPKYMGARSQKPIRGREKAIKRADRMIAVIVNRSMNKATR